MSEPMLITATILTVLAMIGLSLFLTKNNWLRNRGAGAVGSYAPPAPRQNQQAAQPAAQGAQAQPTAGRTAAGAKKSLKVVGIVVVVLLVLAAIGKFGQTMEERLKPGPRKIEWIPAAVPDIIEKEVVAPVGTWSEWVDIPYERKTRWEDSTDEFLVENEHGEEAHFEPSKGIHQDLKRGLKVRFKSLGKGPARVKLKFIKMVQRGALTSDSPI